MDWSESYIIFRSRIAVTSQIKIALEGREKNWDICWMQNAVVKAFFFIIIILKPSESMTTLCFPFFRKSMPFHDNFKPLSKSMIFPDFPGTQKPCKSNWVLYVHVNKLQLYVNFSLPLLDKAICINSRF